VTRPGHSPPIQALLTGDGSLKRIARLAKRTHLGFLPHQLEGFHIAHHNKGAPNFVNEPNDCFVSMW
jgi:hypothetical protein